jgi:pimeloyl-ACP methyl ester carboxylesterase
MRFVTSSGGVQVAVHDLAGSGRPTLFAHATGFHGMVFRPLARQLADHCRGFALDFRAHGASVIPPGSDLDWNRFGDDALAVLALAELSAEPVVGIGHSMGGAALVMAEVERPGTFAAMFLFEPVIPSTAMGVVAPGANFLANGAARRRRAFPSRPEALANYASKPPLNALDPDALTAYVEYGFVEQPDGTVALACRPEDESQTFLNVPTELFGRLDEVTCPVAIGLGDDKIGASIFAEDIAAALPQGHLERFRGLNHFAPLQDPARVAVAIIDLMGI